ncbi:serine/threonine-protein kinase [Streptomyces sp. BV129]|uniref:serine/threonine-protein kinase n=1 Tax=Streptomyces sp. BV129 TaxID=2849671 RepID=UPI001C2E8F9E|nr:serine/threonine-protein kinase [Streptomyces sp. BV129]MBV1946484.1 serine/threonine protein kinase [Streptomyces sp. BV129]
MSEAERAGTSRQETRQGKNERRLLAGRYRLGDVLGRGGMGTVWRAEDETLGRTVAVKELRFPSNIDEEEKRRLITRTLREAKAIARIRNNSAVTVFDVVDEDDRPWIVMELVEGKSLAEVIREDGVLTPRRAAEVGLAVLDVLRSAHREGILHRDVKPSNVLIADDGRVVLTDFGIAQVEGDPSITSTGMLVGAPSYISPERARGHKPGPAADLWSLGGLLYASVEGVPPYDKGSAIATLTAVMTENLEEPKNAGPLGEVIRGLLTKEPAQRLDDAGARAMLNKVIHASEPEPLDATRVVPIPAQPDSPEGKRGEDAGDKVRGALRSVRKAAGASAAAAAARPKSGSGASADARSQSAGATTGAGGRGSSDTPNSSANKPSSSWPVMPSPDLDLARRPAPKASLTDVVPKRTLVVIAVVVALAVLVLGTVLALTLGGDDDKGGAKAAPSAGASAKRDTGKDGGSGGTSPDGSNAATATDGSRSGEASGGAGTADDSDGKGGSGDSDDDSGSSGSSGSSGDKGSGSAPAVTTRKSSQGYSIGLPKGWKYVSTSAAGDRYTGPEGQKLLVGWTSTPKSDPVRDWENQERYMVRSQYDRIRIEKVDYRGWNTADWEFTYVDGGTKYRSIDRGFVVNDHLGHALMYTARSAGWDDSLREDTWKTLTTSFEPKS